MVTAARGTCLRVKCPLVIGGSVIRCNPIQPISLYCPLRDTNLDRALDRTLGDFAVQRNWISVSLVSITLFTLLLAGCGGAGGTSVVASTGGGSAPPTPTPAASPSPTPVPGSPAGTVIDNVQDSPNWLTCGACGNGGGTGPIAAYSFTPGVATPSESGRATNFSISATVPFTNAYWYRQEPVITSQINALTYQFDCISPPGWRPRHRPLSLSANRR